MSSKVEIFNLALSALLLTKQCSDADGDNTMEVRTLRSNWNTALKKTLQDLDLDATSTRAAGQLVAECPTPDWHYAYLYPQNCAFFRRILPIHHGDINFSGHHRRIGRDTRYTQVPRQIADYQNQKIIFTNKHCAWLEYIPSDVPITSLNESAALALAYKLADLSGSLIAGKGAGALRKDLRDQYRIEKAQAQEQDRLENATFDTDEELSEFVQARLS